MLYLHTSGVRDILGEIGGEWIGLADAERDDIHGQSLSKAPQAYYIKKEVPIPIADIDMQVQERIEWFIEQME